jgi:hypothetical protein
MMDAAWGIIANAGGSDWTRESKEWQQAAAQWREEYFAMMRSPTIITNPPLGWSESSEPIPPKREV